ADKVVKVPQMAESISEGTLKQWVKKVGDFVKQDEEVATIETDKIDVTVNSPASGTIVEVFAQEEDTVSVGGDFFKLELGDAPKEGSVQTKKEEPKSETKAEPKAEVKVESKKEEPKEVKATPTPTPTPAAAPKAAAPVAEDSKKVFGNRTENRVKMNRMRLRIAERLKQSQDTAASLTTFNEIDMTNLMNLRSQYKDAVVKKHDVKLGFMSAFVKASAAALEAIPAVNASIEGNEIVYHDYVDVSVAVSTPKGLVTPVLRNVEDMSFIDIEKTIAALGKKARDNKITIEDMAGGTFTISNGGVFGSLMGTPIINMPQAAILGMHSIKERPVVVDGKIEIRPMMYVALTYDHRIIDGREAVTFLVKIKEIVEDPRRLLL
ncbi:dehydrogenase complex E2 component, partial [Phycomyces blakesleeanus NRRL 1555(-)]